MAESTGRFPPMQTDHKAANAQIAAKLGDPAATKPNTAVILIVELNVHLRPKTSHTNPQKTAPTSNSMFLASVNSGAFEGWNSFDTAGKIRDVIASPPESNHHEELPLVSAHADRLNRVVDNPRFGFVDYLGTLILRDGLAFDHRWLGPR
ncbi:unnamed protein product [Penicillium glandicola]